MKGLGRLAAAIAIVAALGALASFGQKESRHPQASNFVRGVGSASTTSNGDAPSDQLRFDLARTAGSRGRGGPSILEQSDRVHVLAGRAVDVVGALRPAAEAGDSKAALGIYLKLRPCTEALKPLDENLLRVYREKGINEKALLESSEARIQECDGASTMLGERGHWLERAADGGNLEAQLLYVADPDAVIGDGADMLRNPERAQRWRAKALGYLDTLVSQGNVDAMLSLSGKYGSGFVVERDPVKAYALARAARLARPDQVPEILIDSYRKQLRADQLREADDLGTNIFESCCGKR